MSRSSERARRSPFLTRVSICTHCFSIRRVPGYERDSGCIFIIDISIQYQNHQRLVLAKITRDVYLYDKTIENWGAQLIHRCVQRLHSRRRPRDCDMSMYQYLSTLHPLAVVDTQSQRPVVMKKSRHRRHFCSEIDFIEELLDANKHLIYHSADSLQHESAVMMGALICIRISGDEWTDQNCHGQMHMPTAER